MWVERCFSDFSAYRNPLVNLLKCRLRGAGAGPELCILPWFHVIPRPRLERSEEEEMTLGLGSKEFTEKKEHKQDLED